jgi:hypothetical protein
MTLNYPSTWRYGWSKRLGLLLSVSSLAIGCGGSSPTTTTPVNCASGTHLEGSTCVANTLTQTQVDPDAVFGLLNSVVAFYNQNLAGRPTGYQNITVNCSGGGTVRITGTTSYSSGNGITTVNLTYAMTNCQSTQISGDGSLTVALTFNGTVTENGSWNLPSYKSAAYQSTGNLGVVGTVNARGYAQATINESCPVGVNHTIGSANSVAGQFCGRNASWSN